MTARVIVVSGALSALVAWGALSIKRVDQPVEWQWMRETSTGVSVGDASPDGSIKWALPYRDIDVSRDGKHWFHLFGWVCVNGLPALTVSTPRSSE